LLAVGGATLGGSGKTPLAIACARELALAGARATLVGHAYRGAPGAPRFVRPGDRIDEVGDEALVAARAFGDVPRAQVVVATRRGDAMAFAARSSDVLVLDGVGQTRPRRAALALLAVDAEDPWGRAGPRGVLAALRDGSWPQAPAATLVSACDAIVPMLDVVDGDSTEEGEAGEGTKGTATVQKLEARFADLGAELGRPVWPALVRSRGAWVGQSLLTWEALRARRVGLITALARPHRVVRLLARRGVTPVAVVSTRDHGPLGLMARLRTIAITRAGEVDLWVATRKCALHAADAVPQNAALAVLDHAVTLGPDLRLRLRGLTKAC
jgi:tetraacyldisaccharide 4'-kinase